MFEWNIFQGRTSLQILQKIQEDLQDRNIDSEKIEHRIIFMSIVNDMEWTKRGNSERGISNSDNVKNYAKKFSQRHWTFLRLGDEKKWYGILNYTPQGKRDSIHSHTNGGRIERNWSSSIQEHQCFESWNSEKKEEQRNRTLQFGCFEHRTLISNDSLSKSAQYLRSSSSWFEDFCPEAE